MSFFHLLNSDSSLKIFFEEILDLFLDIDQSMDGLKILETTVQKTRNTLQCDRVLVYQFLSEEEGVIIAESVGEGWTPLLGQYICNFYFAQNFLARSQQQQISFIENIYTAPLEPCHREFLKQLQVLANLVVPITLPNQTPRKLWGLLMTHQCHSPRQWSSLEKKCLQHLATLLGKTLCRHKQQNIFNPFITPVSHEITQYLFTLAKYSQNKSEELRWQEALLRSMTDTSPLAFYVVDNRTDTILYFNHRFCEIWQIEELKMPMSLGNLKNNDIIPHCIPLIADLPKFIESCKPLQSEENRCIIEDEIPFTDGRTIRRFSSQIRDREDRYFGRLYIFEDITERKRMEEALRESEERYRSLIASMTEGIVFQKADGAIIACNTSAEKILGLTAEQMMGCTSIDPRWHAIHEDGSQFVGENHPAIVTLKTGQPQTNIMMGVHKPDQSLTWISINTQPLFYPDSQHPYAVVASFTDITQRKQLELDIKRSEALFRGIFEQATVGIALVNSSGRFMKVNQRFCQLMGYSPPELQQMTFLDLTHPKDYTLTIEFHRQIWNREIPNYCTDKQYVHQEGHSFWGNVTFCPIYNDQGQLQYGLGVVIDISDRKQAESIIYQQTERERMMHDITRHIRQSLDLDEILNTTVTDVRQFLQTDRVIIYRLNPDWSGIVVTESVAPKWIAILNMEITDSYFVETEGGDYHRGYINNVPDIYHAGFTQCHLELLERLQVRAKLVVPILQQDRTWGLLIAHHCTSPRQWQPFEAELLTQLATQLAIAIQQSELHQQLQSTNQQLENLALIDQLTQIPNRRCFDHDLERHWQNLARQKRPLSLLLCDIDYFKQYNDTYGHSGGDVCLTQVAQALKASARRASDLVARYGGEEFVIILPDTDNFGAIAVAQNIQKTLKELRLPHRASGVSSYVTVSIGIATLIPRSDLPSIELINAADQALYQAKAQGRDRYSSHSI
ncbi:diguanylate cyclase with PAS/PAC and GAF sensors [Gloeothece citriformis PCC 7424]|uniref:Diguanylate cyclase with PAS/PAC and GAF sensors n=1 Tax=Gloeothece citriformis (strain PCC 7424) TaxID=65393 RepID=B7KCD2_GLOC7|nr:diguanylate cyclase [Gloeothece citriformis]ACK70237.1 diguanylate cyclase with PAS/PAC and GAF sensors [Gloeothece citriformis PCC 7424]